MPRLPRLPNVSSMRTHNRHTRPRRLKATTLAPAAVKKDEVFKEPLKSVADFAFGEKVASVFDDMLLRSVPFYEEMQRMIAELSADFAVDGTNIYDLGCSTGTTLLHLASQLPQRVKFIGVDNSEEMLKRCLLYRGSPPGPDWDGVHHMERK